MILEFSERTGFSVDEILGTSRRQEVVAARQLYWKLLREAGGFSYSEIAALSDRSHATVLHGVRVATERIEVRDKLVLPMWEKVKDLQYDYSSRF